MSERDDFGEVIIWIGGEPVRFPLMQQQNGDPGRLAEQNLSTFQGKVVFGSPDKDDNPLLSSLVRHDLSGGSGVEVLNEGTDLTRYDFGTLYARFPGQITKPLYAFSNAVGGKEGTGDKRVLGEMWDAGADRYLVVYMAGMEVRRGVIDTTSTVHQLANAVMYAAYSSGNATNLPVNKGVAFRGTGSVERFYLPYGDGYGEITRNSVTVTEHASPDFQAFALFDNKLVGVDNDGLVYTNVTGDVGDWVTLATTVQIPRSRRIRNIVNFFDRRDAPALYVITDQDIWQLDPEAPDLFRIDYGFPAHPYHGLASTVWNGQLFVSVGMGVMRYTGGSWQPVGLDRDFGLPLAYQGRIVDLVPGYNALYALVQSNELDPDYGGRSSIHEFSGSGWQCVWADDPSVPTTYGTPLRVTGLILTSSGDAQTLVLSTASGDDHVYTLPLSLTFANPRARIASTQVFGAGEQYYWEDGEFDAGLIGYRKIANAEQFEIEEPVPIPEANRDTLTIQYRVDGGAWQDLWAGRADPGRYAVAYGDLTDGDDGFDGIAPGVDFERIKRRVVVDRSATFEADKPMVLKHLVLTYLKVLDGSSAWQGVIDLTAEQGYAGNDNATLRAYLGELVADKRFHRMTYNGVDYRVRVTQVHGDAPGGHDDRGVSRVNILQIPVAVTGDA